MTSNNIVLSNNVKKFKKLVRTLTSSKGKQVISGFDIVIDTISKLFSNFGNSKRSNPAKLFGSSQINCPDCNCNCNDCQQCFIMPCHDELHKNS